MLLTMQSVKRASVNWIFLGPLSYKILINLDAFTLSLYMPFSFGSHGKPSGKTDGVAAYRPTEPIPKIF
jgi:hypothetical protein